MLLALTTVSCLDLKPEAAPPVRWFSIPTAAPEPAGELVSPADPRLRLGALRVVDSIGDRLIRRVSAYEVTYDDLARWSEPPQGFLERALDSALFRTRLFTEDPAADRRLDVELVRFEERLVPRRVGAVAIQVMLTNRAGDALFRRRIEAVEPISGEDPALVAEALAEALHRVVAELVELLSVQ